MIQARGTDLIFDLFWFDMRKWPRSLNTKDSPKKRTTPAGRAEFCVLPNLSTKQQRISNQVNSRFKVIFRN